MRGASRGLDWICLPGSDPGDDPDLMKELRILSGRGSPGVFSKEELETVTEETDVWMFLLELLLDPPTEKQICL